MDTSRPADKQIKPAMISGSRRRAIKELSVNELGVENCEPLYAIIAAPVGTSPPDYDLVLFMSDLVGRPVLDEVGIMVAAAVRSGVNSKGRRQ